MDISEKNIQPLIDSLAPTDSSPDPHSLLRRIHETNEISAKRSRLLWKPAWAAVIVIGAFVAGMQFKPVRVWATEFLSLFRVQQIAVVRIDPANLDRLENDLFGRDSERRLEQLFSDQAHVVKHGEARTVSSATDAGRIAGFGVRIPEAVQTISLMQVHPAVDVSLTIDVERLQGILDEAGRSEVHVPKELDGELIRINVPASVTTFFGKCPDFQKSADQSDRRHAQEYPECRILAQLPSPVVVAPPSLNVTQVGNEMLKLLGFTADQAEKFSKSIDWSSTLVVPIPMDPRMDFSEVSVDGVKGELFQIRKHVRHGTPTYNLVWIRDGILYSLMGYGTGEDAVNIANSM
jgi:hypothetical protein